MDDYYEQFYNNLNSLPNNVQRNLSLITELDKKAGDLNNRAINLSDKYYKNVARLSAQEKTNRFKEITKLHEKASFLTREKVRLAEQVYNLVDEQIHQIDQFVGREQQLNAAEDAPEAKRRGRKKKSEVLQEETAKLFNMAIDPAEPIYCQCRQVSYGQMIACDAEDCPYEWFHYECLGITSPPVGKWYCPLCTEMANGKSS